MELELEAAARIAGDYNTPTSDKGLNPADVAALQAAILEKLTYRVGKRRSIATDRDWLMATAYALRDQIVDRWLAGIDRPTRRAEAGLLPVAGIPDRPPAVRQPEQSRT